MTYPQPWKRLPSPPRAKHRTAYSKTVITSARSSNRFWITISLVALVALVVGFVTSAIVFR